MKKSFMILMVLVTVSLVLVGCNNPIDQASTDPIEQTNPVTDFEYSVNDEGGIIINKYVGTDTEVVIPEKIEGSTVTQIGKEAFANNTSIVSVKMPDTITTIKDLAFKGCSHLTTVVLSQNLSLIYGSAFSDCTDLSEIVLPDSLAGTGANVFKNCTSLKYINIPGKLEYIGDSLFENSGLEAVEIEEGTKFIGNYAFSGTNLKEVTMPQSMKSINEYVFYSCHYLESVKLNEGLTTIDWYVFTDTPKLKEIIIPESVTKIEEAVFYQCDTLEKVMFEGNAPETYKVYFDMNGDYTIYYHSGATGFTSPEWNGYKTEIW